MRNAAQTLSAKLAKAQNILASKMESIQLRDLNVLKAMVLSCASHKNVSTLVISYETVCEQYHRLWLLSAVLSPDDLRAWQAIADTAYDQTKSLCFQYKCDIN